MKHKGIAKKAGTFLITAILAAAFAVQTAAAVPAESEKAALTIQASSDGTGIAGVEWSVYQVAEMPQDGVFILTGDFAASGLDIDGLNDSSQSAMQKNAVKSAAFVSENKIKAAGSEVTDKNGRAKIGGLERGLYLVSQTGTPGTDRIVKSMPFFAALPMMVDEGGKMVMKYEVTAAPKLEVEQPPETEAPSTETPSTEAPSTEAPSTEETDKPSTEASPTSSAEESTGETGSASQPSQPPSTGSGGSSGGHDRDRGNTTVIIDSNTPLSSFPQAEPQLEEIGDEPVPLAALPSLPKMGDMGAGAYATGMLISILTGCTALIRRKKYTGGKK